MSNFLHTEDVVHGDKFPTLRFRITSEVMLDFGHVGLENKPYLGSVQSKAKSRFKGLNPHIGEIFKFN